MCSLTVLNLADLHVKDHDHLQIPWITKDVQIRCKHFLDPEVSLVVVVSKLVTQGSLTCNYDPAHL